MSICPLWPQCINFSWIELVWHLTFEDVISPRRIKSVLKAKWVQRSSSRNLYQIKCLVGAHDFPLKWTLTWVVITCQVMVSGENWVLKHQTFQCHLKISITVSKALINKVILVNQLLMMWCRLRQLVLTRKSPPHSCKQCKTSSWLVPPPLSTLQQAMLIRSSTGKTTRETMTKKQIENKRLDGKWRETLTALLVTVLQVGVLHRDPNQVSFVLVKLGGGLILLEVWDLCLVMLPNIDTAEWERKESRGGWQETSKKKQKSYHPVWMSDDSTYGSRLTGVASVIIGRTGGVISELAERPKREKKNQTHTCSENLKKKSVLKLTCDCYYKLSLIPF